MNGPERNYCTTRKELLAVIFFVKQFRPYLLGRHFVIRTDHAALRWLKNTPEPIGQQARWLETLEGFDYEIEHRPGAKHCNADALSRRPCRQCHMDNSKVGDVYARSLKLQVSSDPDDPWSPECLAAAYKDDPETGEFYRLFQLYGADIPWREVVPCSRFTKAYWAIRARLRIFMVCCIDPGCRMMVRIDVGR